MVTVLAAACCQCATGPALERRVQVQEGSRALVIYQQPNVNLTLINQSALTKDQAIAARNADRSLKLIPDQQLQLLLDMLAAQDFFDLSATVADPEARSWLTVVIDGQKHILSGRSGQGDHAYIKRYADCINLFTTVYNANDSFAGSKMTPNDLKRAGQDTNAASEAIRRRKGGSKRP